MSFRRQARCVLLIRHRLPLISVFAIGMATGCSTQNTPPTAALIYPPADTVQYPGTVTLIGEASDAESPPDELVGTCGDTHSATSFAATISSEGEVLCESPNELPEGDYYFTLSVLDPQGATATSEELHIVLTDVAPTVVIEQPENGAAGYSEVSPVTFVAYVTDEDQPSEVALSCSWTSDDVLIGTAQVDPLSFRCTLSDITLDAGNHTIKVVVTDDYGKEGNASITLPIKDCTDSDGDGYYVDCGTYGTIDCHDNNPSIHPGADEVCDGVHDDDCDGVVDNVPDADGDGYGPCQGDCDDSDAAIYPLAEEVCDGVDNNCNFAIDEGFDQDHDAFTTCEGDCDDLNAEINPRAQEICDEIDNNCDAQIDEGVEDTFYTDADGDGYGDQESPVAACSQPTGTVTNNDDCDDTDIAVFPGNGEICNGIDDNCDGSIDEGTIPFTYYVDADGDGFGVADLPTLEGCVLPEGYALDSGDCDDERIDVNPQAEEVCDEADNNCDGSVDENVLTEYYPDQDGDDFGLASGKVLGCTEPEGYAGASGDCNDNDPSVYPGAIETCDDQDEDCDGEVDDNVESRHWYKDNDQDGYGTDLDSTIDCKPPDGYVSLSGDCDDSNPDVNPEGTETCNGKDDDCDGQYDEGVQTQYWIDADEDSFGDDSATAKLACSEIEGYVTNDDDCDDSTALTYPGGEEICDGGDNNCNGVLDEGLTQSAFYRDKDGDDFGDPSGLIYACASPDGYTAEGDDCNDLDAEINPDAVEVCDGLDNNCDGDADEGTDCTDDDGDGYCEGTSGVCVDGSTVGDCDDTNAGINPLALESSTPNGIDDNCDGTKDEGTICWDDDNDSYLEAESPTACPGYPDAFSEPLPGGNDCNDDDNAIFPNAAELFNGIDDDCDGVKDGFMYLSDVRIKYVGDVENSQAGLALAGLGDINLDGHDDFAVGAPLRHDHIGAVFVVFGKAEDDWSPQSLASAGLILSGDENSPGEAGRSIAGIGDLDKDGISDFVVGAPFRNSGNMTKNGCMYLFYGKESGWASGSLETAKYAYSEGVASNGWFGYGLAGGGDFNNDGYTDLVVGGPKPTATETGNIRVLPGRKTRYGPINPVDPGSIAYSEFIKVSGAPNDALGVDVAFVQGFDDDGIDDIVAAGFGTKTNVDNAGAVYYVFGSEIYNTADTYDVIDFSDGPYRGDSDYEEIGYSVSNAGDVNGDGREDFLVGRKKQAAPDQGVAYLFLGGYADRGEDSIQNVADVYFSGVSGACPCSVAGFGDVNGDGYDDFGIGLSKSDLGGADSGAVYLYYGGPGHDWLGNVTLDEADAIFVGSQGEMVGSAIAGAGDVNGSGLADILIGGPGYDDSIEGTDAGRVYLLFGF